MAKIADDFKAAYDNLPESQGTDVGRANKYSAAAYLAKTYLYKAYRQDEKHNVTEINAEDLKQVLTFSNEVMSSDYGLEDDLLTTSCREVMRTEKNLCLPFSTQQMTVLCTDASISVML